MDRTNTILEWAANEPRAAATTQERRSEELQLERLKLRLHDKMREAAAREDAHTAA
jgi:hypothetical protein